MLEFTTPPIGPLTARGIAFKEFPNTHFWIWNALNHFYGESALEEWKEIDGEDDTFLIACSQLSTVAIGMDAHGHTGRYFAREEDLLFARRYPVLLTQQELATMPPQRPSNVLVGIQALILDGETLRFCALEHLDAQSQDIWATLKQGITLIPPRRQPNQRSQDTHRNLETMEKEYSIKRELWARAKLAARQLAIQYWHLHEEMKKLEASSHYRQLPQTPSILRGMRGKGVVIPQLDPVEGVLLALSNAQREDGGWKVINAVPTYTHERPTSTTEVTVRPQEAHVVTGDITGQLWQQVRQFNDVDGDIFLALLAQFLGTPPDMHDGPGVWITTQQILEYRGIEPKMHKKERTKVGESGTHRRGGHRREDMQEIADGMSRIRDTHITVRSWKESHRKKTTTRPTRKRVYQQESYLITITDFIQQSQLFVDGNQVLDTSADTGLAVAWYYKPGSCLETFLTGPNYRAAWLLQQALKYDPYHQQWEKRLARYFIFQMRVNAEFGGTTIQRTIRTLFDELALPVNGKDPNKTRERFEKAMQCLLDDNIISSWGPEALYQQWLTQRPRYNWFDTWLDYQIEFCAYPIPWEEAQILMEHLQEQRQQQRKMVSQGKDKTQESGTNTLLDL